MALERLAMIPDVQHNMLSQSQKVVTKFAARTLKLCFENWQDDGFTVKKTKKESFLRFGLVKLACWVLRVLKSDKK